MHGGSAGRVLVSFVPGGQAQICNSQTEPEETFAESSEHSTTYRSSVVSRRVAQSYVTPATVDASLAAYEYTVIDRELTSTHLWSVVSRQSLRIGSARLSGSRGSR